MKKYIVFDIGGTFIKWAIIDQNYKMILNGKFPTKAKEITGIEMIQNIGTLIKDFQKEHTFEAIGISTPGAVDIKNGIVVGSTSNFIKYENINVRKVLKSKTGLNTYITNDGNCSILGEMQLGSLNDVKNAFSITIGTGIGGGLLIDGKLVVGNKFWAAEIGYQNVKDFKWEKRCSTKALLEEANKIISISSGEEFFSLLKNNNNLKELYDEFLDNLAIGIANITMVTNPQVFLIGGGISENKLFNVKDLEKRVFKFLPNGYPKEFSIRKTKLGNDANIFGAGYLAINKISS